MSDLPSVAYDRVPKAVLLVAALALVLATTLASRGGPRRRLGARRYRATPAPISHTSYM